MKNLCIIGALACALVACSGGGGATGMQPGQTSGNPSLPTLMTDSDPLSNDLMVDDSNSQNATPSITTIGSTVDPTNGDQNPYGLDIAPMTSGDLTAGDLVVCNFNNSANVQGTGTSIVALHPHTGATPMHILADSRLDGCNALALGSTDNIWTADFSANNAAIVSPSGTFMSALPGGPWNHPFGMAFANHAGPFGAAAFYVSNAGDGSIVRVNISSSGNFTFDKIATGFPVNNGVPGSILGPSGLQYDANRDRLYIVDGQANAVVAFRHVSTIPAGGIVINGNCSSFTGPFARRAKLIFAGAPLNGPISSALLKNEHLVVGNTLDPNGKNLMIEITPGGHVRSVRNVDTGAAGSIFGMVAVPGETGSHQGVYFNDDNNNAVEVVH